MKPKLNFIGLVECLMKIRFIIKQKNIEDEPARERLGLIFSYIHTESKRIFNENLPLDSKHIKEGAPFEFCKKKIPSDLSMSVFLDREKLF